MHKALEYRLNGIRQALMGAYYAGKGLANASRGSEREILIREYLSKVSPPTLRFGSGTVLDGYGNTSGQLDIVVEYPWYPSFPTPSSEERLYLAESVVLAISVKSDLAAQWHQVEKEVEQLAVLRRNWRTTTAIGRGAVRFSENEIWPVPLLAIGYEGHASVETLRRRMEQTPEDRRPAAALVLDSSVFVGWNGVAEGGKALWNVCIAIPLLAAEVTHASTDLTRYEGTCQSD